MTIHMNTNNSISTAVISTHDNCVYGLVLAKKLDVKHIALVGAKHSDNEFVHDNELFNYLAQFKQIIIVCSNGVANGDERIMRLLLIAHELKKREIKDIQLVMPYLPYSREIATFGSTVIQLFASAGIQKLFCFQMHESFSQAIAGIEVYAIDGAVPIAQDIKKRLALNEVVLFAPDQGAVVLVQKVAQLLDVPFVCAKKKRNKNGDVLEIMCDEQVTRKHIIIIDDIISTGSTFVKMINALRIKPKNYHIYGYFVHGVFAQGIEEVVSSDNYRSLAVSDSLFVLDEYGPDIDYRYFDTADYFVDQITDKLQLK